MKINPLNIIRATMPYTILCCTLCMFTLTMRAELTASSPEMTGLVQTVTGVVLPNDLGIVLTHEHMVLDLGVWGGTLDHQRVPFEQAKEHAVKQLKRAKQHHVQTVIDMTPAYCGRNAKLLYAISQAIDCHIVASTGFFHHEWMPRWAHNASVNEIAEFFIKEITVGIEDTTIKAGFIKLGSMGDLTPLEQKVHRAALRASLQTGAPIGAHLDSHDAMQIRLKIMQEENFPPERFVWIHAASATANPKNMDLETWLQFAPCGNWHAIDADVKAVKLAIAHGRINRILLGQDSSLWRISGKHNGPSDMDVTYLFTTFIPALRNAGISRKTMRQILIENPRDMLVFQKPYDAGE
ncbi:phosphotriesterase family protein [Poriferisphaera sp. WC338]|uniref:phosphotriesterase family protein n=1 Tax=Poriferisphaera sp. WC338 TaxID=3425129 RepID=UPI003D814C3E